MALIDCNRCREDFSHAKKNSKEYLWGIISVHTLPRIIYFFFQTFVSFPLCTKYCCKRGFYVLPYSLLMRNTCCHESVVYAVNNPSPSAVYGVDSCGGASAHCCFRGKYPRWEKFNGEELHHRIPPPSSRRFSIKLKIVRERRINFRKSNQLRLDSGRYSTEACSILQAIKNFFSLEGIIYGALAPTV